MSSDPPTVRAWGWAKGHGTENDFVLLPDPDGIVHGPLTSPESVAWVAALCDRHRGLGADGVIRVVRASALATAHDVPAAKQAVADGVEWFMDYRNADGSTSEMCGNGIRVLAQWLAEEGLLGAAAAGGAGRAEEVRIGTRSGTLQLSSGTVGRWSVDMGPVARLPASRVSAGSRSWPAIGVDAGNPHVVVEVADLAEAGPLIEPPAYDTAVYPDGVNVEFVAAAGERHVRMRVHERGSGETRSCGTGACAAAVLAERLAAAPPRPASYRVDVPGGRLDVLLRADGHAVLTGPAEVVARGTMSWSEPWTGAAAVKLR
ncbi:diaminopimelate epimerase [soil metagenome]